MKELSIYVTELKRNAFWHIFWLIFLFTYAIWIYNLWLTFLMPFLVIILFMYSVLSGVRVSVKSISDKTGELLYTLPLSRKKYFIVHLLSNFTPLLVFFSLQFIIMTIHNFGPQGLIDQNKIVTISLWGMLFTLYGLLIGSLIGLLTGNTTKGYQISVMVTLISFIIKNVIKMNPSLNAFVDFDPLTYYQPNEYLLFKSFVKNSSVFSFSFPLYPIILLVLIILLVVINLRLFNQKDLIDDGRIHLNINKRISFIETKKWGSGIFKIIGVIVFPFLIMKNLIFPKETRNNPFVFWARIFEKKLPVTADFIYSDNVILFIVFIAFFFLFPFQIGHYPGNIAVQKSISSFGQSKIFFVITYGHNLSNNPYLWFLSVNTIGIIWFILVPLSFTWVFKAFIRDGNSGYGEIFGGVALDNKQVVFQRMLAIFIELLFVLLLIIFWLVFTEVINGQTYDREWEIISVISLLPLYIFIISFSAVLSLLFKNKGFYFSLLVIITSIVSFVASFLMADLNIWIMRGLFSLYDPILIIEKKSLLINGYGTFTLIILDLLIIIGLVKNSPNYSWLNIS